MIDRLRPREALNEHRSRTVPGVHVNSGETKVEAETREDFARSPEDPCVNHQQMQISSLADRISTRQKQLLTPSVLLRPVFAAGAGRRAGPDVGPPSACCWA